MNEFVLGRSDVQVLLSHTALYGLAAILAESGVEDVRLGWTTGVQPRPWVSGDGLSRDVVDRVVQEHATARSGDRSWVQRDIELKGEARGLMSPRLTPLGDRPEWKRFQDARHQVLDALTDEHAWSDLAYLAALGEPCYWSHNRQDQLLQDDGASRLEMQPRNRGSEFVGSRLRKLAMCVAARAPGAVADGVDGTRSVDEVGADRVDSRTATGLTEPGPADNALAWCALWGLGQLPTVPRVNATATTSGHLGRSRGEWFHVPVWSGPWRPARLRTILAGEHLRTAATAGLPARSAADPSRLVTAQAWLAASGVVGLVRFRIERFGSASAPERRAMRGTKLPLSVS